MKKIIKVISLFLVVLCLAIGCSKKESNDNDNNKKEYLNEITFSELQEKLNNKEDLILEIVQTGCSNCTAFSPKFEAVLEEYDIEAYSLNITYLSVDGSLWLDEYGVDGTPTVIFFEGGEEVSTLKRIVGNQTKEKIISKLKANGYIK